MSKRKIISIALGLGVTTVCLWMALRNVQLAALERAFGEARWIWILPMSAIVCLDIVIRALRWRVLLSRAGKPLSVLELAKLEAIGLGVNNVLFLRLGEVARAALAARRLDIPILTSLASVIVERALDVAALLAIFLIAARLAPGFVPPALLLSAEILLGCAVLGLLVLALAESWMAEGGFLEKFLRPWPGVHRWSAQLFLGAAVLRGPGAALSAIALSLSLWSVDAVVYWCGARALGLDGIVDYSRSVLVLSWAAASSALPAAPGAIGTFEAIVGDIMRRFGAGGDAAFAYALICHMVMYLIVTVGGFACLYGIGLSLSELAGEAQKK